MRTKLLVKLAEMVTIVPQMASVTYSNTVTLINALGETSALQVLGGPIHVWLVPMQTTL